MNFIVLNCNTRMFSAAFTLSWENILVNYVHKLTDLCVKRSYV